MTLKQGGMFSTHQRFGVTTSPDCFCLLMTFESVPSAINIKSIENLQASKVLYVAKVNLIPEYMVHSV